MYDLRYWLMKSEPTVYGIAALERDRQTVWDGVRNYQARNFLREMQVGDLAFFYHSSTEPPGIAGLMQVVGNLDDPTQFDPISKYYDAKSTQEKPRWQTVQVEFVQQFPHLISLDRLRQTFTPEELWVVRQGNRLSVMPVETAIARRILEMSRE
jgi:predicted RNA-binding protein with PUA-like domain